MTVAPRTRNRATPPAPGAETTRPPQPLDTVIWRDRNTLKPNAYNPNKVAGPEMRLLKISIMEDGWTQPIVVGPELNIIDGFHRWTTSGDPEVFAMTGGMVPTVMVVPKNAEHRMMSTIRHNRARGTHGVLPMAEIVRAMLDEGLSQQEIMHRLQMEEEEVVRLALRVGIPKSKIIQDSEFGKSWVPED